MVKYPLKQISQLEIKYLFPILPNTVNIFYKNTKGAKDMYKILINQKITMPTGVQK